MFVYVSATVAILTAEPAAGAFMRCLDAAHAPITSAHAIFETATALSRKLDQDTVDSEAQLARFLSTAGIRVIPLTDAEGPRPARPTPATARSATRPG